MDREKNTDRPCSPRSGAPVPVNPNGRPKGVPNKSTTAVRNAIAAFVDNNSAHIQKWADEIYDKKGAEGAMQVFMGLLEYAQPKLARTEMVGDKDAPMQIEITRRIVDPKEDE